MPIDTIAYEFYWHIKRMCVYENVFTFCYHFRSMWQFSSSIVYVVCVLNYIEFVAHKSLAICFEMQTQKSKVIY